MADPATGSGAGKLASEVVRRVAPTLVQSVVNLISGRSVLVVGQAQAGKTSFYEFLRFGELAPEHYTEITYDETRTKSFAFRIGRDGRVELRIRCVRDVAGEAGAVVHAKLVQRRKPHALVVVTDLTTPINGEPDRAAGAWLELFCDHLADKLRTSRRTRRALQSIIVLMNQRDHATPKRVETRERAFRRILTDRLSTHYGVRAKTIPILPCILVDTKHGTNLADNVVRRLARDLVS